ncbi:MAG: hypothetical protein QGG40_14590, partial [Myxococcota bacterium]|nr:hypothetical protein [Myxococcota bacterium]
MSKAEQLLQLAERLRSGQITRQQFEDEKARLLDTEDQPTDPGVSAVPDPSQAQQNSKRCYNCNAVVDRYAPSCGSCSAQLDPDPAPPSPPRAPQVAAPPEEIQPAPTLGSFLEDAGFSQYLECFRENDITVELLKELSNADLKDMGVSSLGHRKGLLAAIETMAVDPPKPGSTPTAGRPTAMPGPSTT